MDFLEPELEKYIADHTDKEPSLLYKLYRETNQKVINPRMLAGHVQGRVISMISHMVNPKRILEIGTYTGYSALCWAEGLAEDGKIVTIDINEELEPMVARYIEEGGYSKKIEQRIGPALDIIPTLEEEWDIVFIDADKPNYCNYFDAIIDRLKPGALIIADNVLWSGKIVDHSKKWDKSTKAIDEYNKKVQADSRVQSVLFPVRDGFTVSRVVG